MFQRLFTVKYITSKNCFCSLSFNNLKLLQGTSILLNYNDDQSAFFTIDMGVSLSSDQHIGISSLYAKILGIAENSVVSASVIPKPTAIKTVTVCAISNDDHSVLELLAENIQSTLLNQIRLLYHDQKFVIWVGNVIYVTVRVCSVKPISPGLLENLTEVVIKSEPHSDELKKFSSKKDLVKFDTIFSVHSRELVLRLVPCSQLDEIQDFVNPFNVFISRFNLTLNLNTKSQPFICSMRSLSEPGEAVFVRVYILEDIIEGMTFKMLCMENVFVSATILDYFSCKMGTRVVLEPVLGPPPLIEEIEVYTKTKSSEDTFRQFLGAACKTQAFVLSPDVPFSVAGLKCFVKLLPCESRFCLVGEDSVKDLRLSVYNVEMAEEKKAEGRDDDCEEFLSEVSNYQDIVDNCLFLLGYNTKPYLHMYNILITGKAGTGKSTLLKNIEKTITAFPHFIYTVQVNCKKIKGKSVESLHKTFVNILFDLVLHQPSVLILDDLHVLCERVVENDILNQNSVYFNRVSEMLEGLLQTFCEYNSVGVLASSHSISKLNKHVYSTRGNHLFKNLYQITELSKADREKLLQFYFSHNKLDGVDLERLAEKTESFVVRDLVDFANKATFESFQEYQNQSVITIKPKHCEVALLTTVVTSLEGVKLLPAGTKDLNDVGGLEGAKKVLLETLRWPSKFPGVFSNSPLRVPTGLLLYGPPGTGKTLLAGAAARHCGLNLISIKGPELLSKYIGASEQAVRDLFQKAQSARPCILFFDEFDSLAPRRGHDNTGVTDRVVNQLLTQLDGIETLSGVFVLAATSRPDLLDPALLRPGRLDRHIRCSLPDKMDRFEILKVLSRNMKLAPDVKLRPVAEAARGHSGADLQAVLYSAQLESVKYLLEDEFQEDATDPQTEITQDQLMHAVKNTRPSLKSSELSKYERIYNRFEGKIPDDFAPGTRATLA